MPLVDRWLRAALLVALVLPMALACNDDVEEGCPAMESVLEKAEADGRLEALPRSVSGNGYEIHLEDRKLTDSCFIVYRFRIAGVNRETWEPGPRGLLEESVCGPAGAYVGTEWWQGDELMVESGLDQWRPSGTYRIGVGAPACGSLTLTFTHVGRLDLDMEK
jgi:hypothetical protein